MPRKTYENPKINASNTTPIPTPAPINIIFWGMKNICFYYFSAEGKDFYSQLDYITK
jgi:hypothetical protein